MEDDRVFRALAAATRRLLLDRLFEHDGRTLGDLEEQVPDLSRYAVMQHLRVLEEAGLVVSRKRGREKLHYLNPVPIRLLYERWIDKYRAGHVSRLLNLRDRLEASMDTTTASATQVYQLYIKATPEEVWEAITKPELVALYFHGAQRESTYEPGTPIRSWSPDRSRMWGDNVILESDPPRKLSHTWRSLYDDELAAEAESRVTWEIEPAGKGYCKLTLIHDRLEGAPKTAASVRGWSFILSGLKTVVETGSPLVSA